MLLMHDFLKMGETRRVTNGSHEQFTNAHSLTCFFSDHEKACSYTHICIVDGCRTLLKLLKPKNKSYYTATKAFDHVRKKHDAIDLDGKHVSEEKQVRECVFVICPLLPLLTHRVSPFLESHA